MYDIGDIFQRFYQAIVQMAGEGNCDAWCQQNTTGQYGERKPDKMADWTVASG